MLGIRRISDPAIGGIIATVSSLACLLLAGCGPMGVITQAEMSHVRSGAQWPAQEVGGVVGMPDFGEGPSAVYDWGNYVVVSYEGVTAEEAGEYVDSLSQELFTVYDNRVPNISASFSDERGNSVTVTQMPDDRHALVTAISILKAS